MADQRPKGSIVFKILIVILAAALVGTILYPKHLWEREEANTRQCRENMVSIMYAEYLYLQERNTYTDTLQNLLNLILGDTTKSLLWQFARTDTALAEDVVNILSKRDTLAAAIADTVTEYCRLNDIENPTARVVDSLLTYSEFAHFIDSVATRRLSVMGFCPTVQRGYNIAVIDTSVFKEFVIECPITKEDSLAVAGNFLLSRIGGLTITNHGRIETGKLSWE